MPVQEGKILESEAACQADSLQLHPPSSSSCQTQHLRPAALRAYTHQAPKARQDKLIIEYLPMVHKIARQVVSYLHPPLSRDDLISAGTIGLVKAARDFDSNRDAEFKTYAYIRIRGAILDELRGWSFAPSSAKKNFEKAKEAFDELTERLDRMPTDQELAEELGITSRRMYRIFENARAKHFLSIHGMDDETPALGHCLTAPDSKQPGEGLEKAEMIEELTQAIEQLPKKQRRIVILYYHKELTMKQIASVLKITESRVSQLHASALFKLSGKLKQYDDSGT